MKSLLALAFAVIFAITAAAQSAPIRERLAAHPEEGSAAQPKPGMTFNTLPSLCSPCVFYGGDNNGPSAGAFAYGNTLLVPDSSIYAAVDVPKGLHGVITGILFMTEATLTGTVFDPATAPYDIRVGVSQGNGGKSVASGSNTMSYAPYSQSFGFEIYENAVNLTSPFTVTPGTRYWFSLVPQCTNTGNSNCSSLQYFFPNTDESNGFNPGAQPPYEMFENSSFFGFNWQNLCNGKDSPACARGSYGLMGHR